MKIKILLLLWAAAGAALGACFEDAENSSTAWTMSGLWHREDALQVACAGAYSGSHAFYFGVDSQCNYDDHQIKDGSLTSPPFYVSGIGDTNFSFRTKWQVESYYPGCYDLLTIECMDTAAPGVWTRIDTIGPPNPPNAPGPDAVGIASLTGMGGDPGWIFYQNQTSFTQYAGRTIQVRFRFLSGDGTCGGAPDALLDNFLGWVVDDISIGCISDDLSLAKSVKPASAVAGSTVTYTILAKNLNASAQTLGVWDTLPSGANFVSASIVPTQSGQFLSWSLASVPGGGSQAITMLVSIDPSAPCPSDRWNTATGNSTAGGATFTSPGALLKLRNPLISISKSASPATLTSGDRVTFTITVSNFTSLSQTIDVSETYPSGFIEMKVDPPYDSYRAWQSGAVMPGDTRYFTVIGFANGINGQVLTNKADAFVNGISQGSTTASVSLVRPEVPQLSIRTVYPNPAPSGKAGLPQSAFVVYEINQAMNLTLDIFTVVGEKVRTLPYQAARGLGQVEWDLRNSSGAMVASGIYVARLWVDVPQLGLVEAWAHIAVLQ